MALPTAMGILCSLVTWIVVVGYAVLKTNVLISRNDINVVGATNELFYDSDYVFDYA